MEGVDFYEVLGLLPGSSPGQIESAYHVMIGRRPPLSRAERSKADRAYLILADPVRRAAFDRKMGYRIHPGLMAGSPQEARIFFENGLRSVADGRWPRAHRLFRRAVTLQPWEALYRSYLGLSAAHLGKDLRQSRDLCLEALRLAPENMTIRNHLARIYKMLGFEKRARRTLEGKPKR